MDVSCGVRELAQLYCDFKCTVNQALTRLASYEQRVTLMVGHVQSVTGTCRDTHTCTRAHMHTLRCFTDLDKHVWI